MSYARAKALGLGELRRRATSEAATPRRLAQNESLDGVEARPRRLLIDPVPRALDADDGAALRQPQGVKRRLGVPVRVLVLAEDVEDWLPLQRRSEADVGERASPALPVGEEGEGVEVGVAAVGRDGLGGSRLPVWLLPRAEPCGPKRTPAPIERPERREEGAEPGDEKDGIEAKPTDRRTAAPKEEACAEAGPIEQVDRLVPQALWPAERDGAVRRAVHEVRRVDHVKQHELIAAKVVRERQPRVNGPVMHNNGEGGCI
mmetsp:Transcript_45760/g.148910  ORF Transcript_45760/g.148910 Transcript_45760/m.148910 type:complete len:260 (-) Transcript_45760:418-1197(-)